MGHLPAGCHLHAPSWEPRYADALAREVVIHHLPVDPSRWPAVTPQWGREHFIRRRRPYGLLAYSTDAHGRVVRGWFSHPADHAAYAAGGHLTAPIEAAWLAALEPGQPSLPAHLWIGAQRDWPGYREALEALRLPVGGERRHKSHDLRSPPPAARNRHKSRD